eukprot:gene12492-6240_t
MLPMLIFFKNGIQVKNYSSLTDDYYLVDRNICSTDRLNIILTTLTQDVSSGVLTSFEKAIPIEKDDLIIHVNKESMECLNQSKQHNIKDLISNIEGKYLESQSDEQLLIFFTFTVRLALKQISFKGIEAKSCPWKVKLFVNKTDLDFDSAMNLKPDQELEISEKEGMAKLKLSIKNQMKFKSITYLTIFVESNQGGAKKTQIESIGLFEVKSLRNLQVCCKSFRRVCKAETIEKDWKNWIEKANFYVLRKPFINKKIFTWVIRCQSTDVKFEESLFDFVGKFKLRGHVVSSGSNLYDITFQGNRLIVLSSFDSFPFKVIDSNYLSTKMKYKDFRVLQIPLHSQMKNDKLVLDPYDSKKWSSSSFYSVANRSEETPHLIENVMPIDFIL